MKKIKSPEAVILANGSFPTHSVPLRILKSSNPVICCDGAVNSLEKAGLNPSLIIGDMDSIQPVLLEKYKNKIVHLKGQSDSDLEKTLKFCLDENISKLNCLGISGVREDHLLSNLFLLWNYSNQLDISVYTDSGQFSFIIKQADLTSFPGQQVSIFSKIPDLKITTKNLKFQLTDTPLPFLYKGCSNESLSDSFMIECQDGTLMIFQKYR